MPIHLNEDFNLISRTILQVVSQPDPVSNIEQFGLGNLSTTLFLSPTKTNDLLGSNTFSAGLSAVVASPNQGLDRRSVSR